MDYNWLSCILFDIVTGAGFIIHRGGDELRFNNLPTVVFYIQHLTFSFIKYVFESFINNLFITINFTVTYNIICSETF